MTTSLDDTHRHAAGSALAAASLFLLLLAMSLVGGVSQQWFESVRPVALYAERLRLADAPLRALIAVDAVFIACYTASGVLLGQILARGRWAPLPLLLIAGTVAAAVLDLVENNHILAMLAAARDGVAPSQAALEQRMTYSAVKWMLAHIGFFFAGLLITGRTPFVRVFRFALLAVQLPVGVAVWTVGAPGAQLAAELLRALNLFVGFAAVAWLARHPQLLFAPGGRESDSGAPG